MRGAIPSPNIWKHPDVYELENRAVDPDGVIPAAMRRMRDWAGEPVLDIGCGTGFHLPMFAATAASVIGVEPHRGNARQAARRVAGLSTVDVRVGVAQALPVADRSIAVAHARWSYFFGPGCEPGLRELERVMRRGGVAFIIDNDATRSFFGPWFRRQVPSYDPIEVERFWGRHGFSRQSLDMGWRFESRADLEAVVRIEFSPALADEFCAAHQGLEVDYAVNLWSRSY
ncbi:class I SAM-dependent methyltransferase [Fodinicola feengrottensis]|uniref:Class I SAM-dependent methyltransferase n=1 Tax=Fodinicola feengrottensis TaxID=435914 RepID=A0ABN2IHQ4_9ACTN|nr:class I SAM-dependent methyltransferase [Fodinicola feengrottensis]